MNGNFAISPLLLLPLIAGCVTVHVLRAEPAAVCKGGKSTLTWEASKHGFMSSKPPALYSAVEEKGSMEVSPLETTTYKLTISGLLWNRSRETVVEVKGEACPAASLTLPALTDTFARIQ